MKKAQRKNATVNQRLTTLNQRLTKSITAFFRTTRNQWCGKMLPVITCANYYTFIMNNILRVACNTAFVNG